MYSEKLEKLITFALADGVLTDKKRQVLLKNAEAEGIDPDEFEMVLDGMLYEKQQLSTTGEMEVPTQVAPQQLENQRKVSSIQQLFKLLEEEEEKRMEKLKKELEKRQTERKQFNVKNVGKIAKNIFADSIPGLSIVSGLKDELLGNEEDRADAELKEEIKDQIIEKKKQIILTFPIPISKDDILEFLSVSVPYSKKGGNEFYEWKQKSEQIIERARISLRNDKNALSEIDKYEMILKTGPSEQPNKPSKPSTMESLLNSLLND
jgi:hypothetical protein